MTTLRDIYIVPLLGLALMPLALFLHIYARYEQANAGMTVTIKDSALRSYAISHAILSFGPRTNLLKRWVRTVNTHRPTDKEGMNETFREVFKVLARERNPTPVPPSEGWCPIKASTYLTDFGLTPNDYHRAFDEWFASTPPVDISENWPSDKITYHVEGNEVAATTLKLVLDVNTPEAVQDSEAKFCEVATVLIQKATGEQVPENWLVNTIAAGGTTQIGVTEVLLVREEFKNRAFDGYSLTLRLCRGGS